MSALKPLAGNVYPNIDLLRGFKRQEIDLILAAAKVRRFPAKSVMTYQGEPANHLLLLWKGRGRYFFETPNGKKLIMIWITPGHIFGGAALAPRASTYLLSSETVRDSVVLVWDGPAIRGLARRYPQLLENAIVSAVDHLSWYIAAHAALCSQTARQRLASVLLGYTSSMGERVSGGIEFDITNEELANAANITPYTASRILSEWQRAGAICKQRGKIFVRFTERLFLLVA
ncbi:MAG TPA: Crp/Fnr family transcriptional regulator [Candidatus Acidoferrum sp.]|jgi:CRP-like cAMP-binding protein